MVPSAAASVLAKDWNAEFPMSSAAVLQAPPDSAGRSRAFTVGIESLQHFMLWLLMASSCFVLVEPAPYEFLFVLTALAFSARGLVFDRVFAPLILIEAFFVAGGLLALPPFLHDVKSVTFVATSVYLAFTAIFFAALIAADPLKWLPTLKSGYLTAAFIAACIGIIGYFNVLGLGEHFTLSGRASGPFKDPNVLGPYLALPIVWVVQSALLGRRPGLLRYCALLFMLVGLLLSFSRGAWGVGVGSVLLAVVLTFAAERSPALRQRIVIGSIVGLMLVMILLAAALAVPAVRDLFEVRASLSQSYDLGEMGRFGSQLRSIPLLLERPLGFGPLQFHNWFPEDPHEVYLNAFASYGWLGGLAYAALTVATLYVGWRLVFRRGPYRREAIAVWACLFAQMVQGLQIDTDHWRHFYLLLGLLFGLAAATRRSESLGVETYGAPARQRAA